MGEALKKFGRWQKTAGKKGLLKLVLASGSPKATLLRLISMRVTDDMGSSLLISSH